ncbi:hypothetical protein FRC04_005214 [Tulasnella sp. 424]|nr:hypothetical protein FRC04_005214 [Tulasnella sp. 424]KAG8963339.1 hypothetical protein FRC05_004776 [Tulasnella sp. 425]
MKILQLDDGVVHIVRSAEEAEELKRTKSGEHFTWHFHGSPEHIDSLRKAHQIHTSRAQALREKHPDVHAEMDQIQHDMADVARELDKMTTSPVELEANFDRFGYDVRIRTHDGDATSEDGKPGDGDELADGALSQGITIKKNGKSPKAQKSTTMKIWRTPVLRQYFHNGRLYRARSMEEVASCELFVDLLYVGIIAFNGDKATEDPTGLGFLRFCVTFIPSWKIWSDVAVLVSQFETDDIFQRCTILFILACLVGYTCNIVEAFQGTYAQLIGFYLAARLFIAALNALMAIVIPKVRNIMILNVVMILIPAALWIGSIFVEGEGKKQGLIWVAIVWDLFANIVSVFLIRWSMLISDEFHQKMLRVFSYYPAINIEHKTERTGAFVSLVFGYSVVALLYQNTASFGMNAFFGKAILALIQAYCFNWIYFDVDASNHHLHAIRRHAISASVWINAHLPFIMGFTISGAALSRLVVAHDSPNTDPHKLTETYEEKSEAELLYGWRWFYCAGLGVAFICMALISATHIHTPLPSQRIAKRHRLAFRIAIAIAWICLPIATNLNSLELIGTTTSMTVLALAVDIYGMSCKNESFWGEEECTYDCKSLSRTSTMVGSEGGDEKQGGIINSLCKTQF